jgi:hypothetical protein
MSWQNGPIQVLAGWYGSDERPDWAATSYATMPTVQAKLQANLASNGGFLVVPPQHHLWLGFDPLPGVHKVLAVQVRFARTGAVENLRVLPDSEYVYPPDAPAHGAPPPLSNTKGDFEPIQVLSAFYGVAAGPPDQLEKTRQTAGVVTARLQENVKVSGGFLALPGAHHIYFGMDPLPGIVKVTVAHIRFMRSGREQQLTIPGFVDFVFPPDVPQPKGAAALAQANHAPAPPQQPPAYVPVAPPSLAPAKGEIWTYDQPDFRGTFKRFTEQCGDLDVCQANNNISCIRCGPNTAVELFLDKNYQGQSFKFVGEVANLPPAINDKASSLKLYEKDAPRGSPKDPTDKGIDFGAILGVIMGLFSGGGGGAAAAAAPADSSSSSSAPPPAQPAYASQVAPTPSQAQAPASQPANPQATIFPVGTGRRRALLIGINYVANPRNKLRGCWNDVKNMSNFLRQAWGFTDVTIMTDELPASSPLYPTGANIRTQLSALVAGARSGDSIFWHYSGHGSQQEKTGSSSDTAAAVGRGLNFGNLQIGNQAAPQQRDASRAGFMDILGGIAGALASGAAGGGGGAGGKAGSGTEMDDCICPADLENGMILDDHLFELLCKPLPSGVRLTCVMDCCHSGTGMDLKYLFKDERGLIAVPTKRELKFGPAGSRSIGTVATQGDVLLFSGCKDEQTSADATINSNPSGAMTFAFLSALRQNPKPSLADFIFSQRSFMKDNKYSQIPQLSMGRDLNPYTCNFGL